MSLVRIGIAIVVAYIGLTASGHAAEYYVATTGNDADSGTLSSPWRTIQMAAETMVAGDIVYVRGGVYEELILPRQSGAAGAYITYRSYPGERAIVRSTDTSASGFCVVLSSQRDLHFLRFSNLTFRGAGGANFAAWPGPSGPKSHLALDSLMVDSGYLGIYFGGGVTHSEVTNCELHHNQFNLYLQGPNSDILIDHNHASYASRYRPSGNVFSSNIELNAESGFKNRRVTISNNHVHHSFTQGIVVVCADDIVVRDNHSHHNGATGIQIEARADPDITKRVVVENNLCEYNSQIYATETGIWIDDSDSVIVQNNVMRYNEHGLRLTGSSQVIVRFNTMYENNHDEFIGASGIYINTSSQNPLAIGDIVVHNTICHSGGNSQRAQVSFGSNSSYAPFSQAVFRNNISSNPAGQYDLWIYGASLTSDYNTFHNSARPIQVVWQGFLTSWATYLTQSGYDQHSIVADPQFVSAATGQFKLTGGSPCIDGGTILTTTRSAGSGTTIEVHDARYFSDGMYLTTGDLIRIGHHDSLVVIAADHLENTVTVNREIAWSTGDGVSYPYLGTAPDMGAFEFDPTIVGDANGDGAITSADVIYLVNFVFKGGPEPVPSARSGDVNCDGTLTSADIIYLVQYVFKSGPAPNCL